MSDYVKKGRQNETAGKFWDGLSREAQERFQKHSILSNSNTVPVQTFYNRFMNNSC